MTLSEKQEQRQVAPPSPSLTPREGGNLKRRRQLRGDSSPQLHRNRLNHRRPRPARPLGRYSSTRRTRRKQPSLNCVRSVTSMNKVYRVPQPENPARVCISNGILREPCTNKSMSEVRRGLLLYHSAKRRSSLEIQVCHVWRRALIQRADQDSVPSMIRHHLTMEQQIHSTK